MSHPSSDTKPMENTEPLTTSQPEISKVENEILSLRNTLQIMPDTSPKKHEYLNSLADALYRRFKLLGNLKDLNDVISSLQEGIRIYSVRHSGQSDSAGTLATGYGSLGAAFLMRFQHLGTFEDVKDAILYLQDALKRLPDDLTSQRQRIQKSGFLTNLGIAFQERFKHSDPPINTEEAFEDLRRGAEKARERVNQANKKDPKDLKDGDKEAPDDLKTAEQTLNDLEKAESKALGDLEMAISTQRKAAEILQEGDEGKPERLNNLGSALLERFWRLKRPEDLNDSIAYHQQAVDLTSDKDLSRPMCLNSLAIALKGRFDVDKDPKDLENAISNLNTAISLTEDNDPNKTNRLLNISIALQERFERLKDQNDLRDAISNAKKAAEHPPGSPRARFFAALQWAKCEESSSTFPRSAFQLAINLLPRIAWMGIPFTDQRAQLKEIGGAVHDAVASAIRHQEYETAVEWTEHGRSIVWHNLVGLRAPLDDLRIKYPGLADGLEDISRRLRRLSPGDKSLNARQATSIVDISTYSKLAIEYDKRLDEIRKQPGFERFLHPKTFSELAPAASEGPVVILNDHVSRADALVLLPNNSGDPKTRLVNIPLEEFASDKSKKQVAELNRLLLEARLRSPKYRIFQNAQDPHNAEFQAMLHELWLHVVKPVIDGLEYKVNTENPSRIWWCATGSFAFLPVHAAGLYKAGKVGDNLTDYAISSYTPTLSSLLDQLPLGDTKDFRILVVAKGSSLQGANSDVEAVKDAAGAPVHLINKDAKIEDVLGKMKESQWVHFSCHGKQDSMKSAFLLNENELLELSEIIQQDLPKADFAYLSACETAMGDETLAEESIHLAAGMLFVGYRGVIGSMWEIGDQTAPDVTRQVYTQIMKDGRPNRKGAALALHNATKRLAAYGSDYVRWLPFIHIGR